jgi:Domain of unknown function (DUF5680)
VTLDLQALHEFAIKAKRACYVGNGQPVSPSRLASHDLKFADDDWSYCDSYFGGTDFLGQEVIWLNSEPTWVMNYYGFILRPDLITPTQAGDTLKRALSAPDSQARLLDNLFFDGPHGRYTITSKGSIDHFSGQESISVNDVIAYALDYHGGLVRP